jgi:hypothetical protein
MQTFVLLNIISVRGSRTHEQNEYKKNPKTAKSMKLSWTSSEEMGRKYETLPGHLA